MLLRLLAPDLESVAVSNLLAVLLSIVVYLAVFAFGCGLLVLFVFATGLSGGAAFAVGIGWGTLVGVASMLTALKTYDALVD